MRLIQTMTATVLALSGFVSAASAGGDAPTYGRPYQSGPQSRSHPAHAPMPQPAAPIWSGFYVGAHGGYARTDAQAGGVAGAQIGYLFQSGRMVFGIEGDVSGTGLESSVSYTIGATTGSIKESADVIGSVRAIAGVDAGSALIYATGGLAFAVGGIQFVERTGGVETRASLDFSASGFVFGAGVEYRFTPRIAVRGEVLRYNFNEITIANTTGKADVDVTVGRAGLSWRFQ